MNKTKKSRRGIEYDPLPNIDAAAGYMRCRSCSSVANAPKEDGSLPWEWFDTHRECEADGEGHVS